MRILFALVLAFAYSARAETFVFSRDGTNIFSAPRELPAVGTRLKDGAPVIGLHGASQAARAACGWYLCVDTNAAPAGMMLSNSVWRIEGAAAVRHCTYRPIPPRTVELSKYRLLEAFKGLGMLDAFMDVLNADAERRLLWDASITIDSGHPLVAGTLAFIKSELGLTDAQIQDIMTEAAAR